MSAYIVGVDLGQAHDHTAIVVLEVSSRDTGEEGALSAGILTRVNNGPAQQLAPATAFRVLEHHYAVRHLERFPLQTHYPAQVERLVDLTRRLSGEGNTVKVVVDQTGVGRPVVDMLRAGGLRPIAVTITAGDLVSSEAGEYRVPKRDLVSTVQVLLQGKRLQIAPGLALAKTLTDELLAFKVTITASGHDRYGNDVGAWREAEHDDLVLATALGCWWGERPVVQRRKRFTTATRHAS